MTVRARTEARTNSQALAAHRRPAQVRVPELWGSGGKEKLPPVTKRIPTTDIPL